MTVAGGRVLVAMSGGVDSSVAAALLLEQGWHVVGATMKLWGGASDTGCCSVADVEDARRVAQQLGIAHHVFNFTADFDNRVVDHYVSGHAGGLTPNPCIECNRHVKFDRFLRRAEQLGFDAVATGHHARVTSSEGRYVLRRAADPAKDQSYVLAMLGQRQLAMCRFPVGEMTKREVREQAAAMALRTAAKPDSQDVCFITAAGRHEFLRTRMALHPGRIVDGETGETVGAVDAIELVTVGQRRGLASGGGRRYALAVDAENATVTIGRERDLLVRRIELGQLAWTDGAIANGTPVSAQCSAHGVPVEAVFTTDAVEFVVPQRMVAPGQTIAMYDADAVLGCGVVKSSASRGSPLP